MTEEDTTVLIVEDDEEVSSIFRVWLEDDYDVLVEYNGSEALSTLEDEDVDVVLLDRLMPGMSGEEVLEEIRDRGYDCMVAMVTAVEPDFDIVRMGFDDYVTKPSSREDLRRTVREVLRLRNQSGKRREYASLCIKKATLETTKDDRQLSSSEEYDEVLSRIEELEEEMDDEVGPEEFLASLRGIDED